MIAGTPPVKTVTISPTSAVTHHWMNRIGFLGLGAIGAPMASHLIAPDIDLRVWNRTPQRARDFVSRWGGHASEAAADAVSERDVVITCLSTSHDVKAVLLADNRAVLRALEPGATVVDCTSGDPATSRDIAELLREQNVRFIDAPVSGGVSGAEQGALTIMVGGSADVLEQMRPVLERFGKRIVHCGDVGAGDAVKAVNNALLAMHIWGTAEGLAALEKAGVDAAVALDVINNSSGRSNASMNLFPERVLTRAFPRTFRLALLDKDVGIAAGVARAQKTPSPLLQLTAELFTMAHMELGEDADHVEAVRVVERMANQDIGGES